MTAAPTQPLQDIVKETRLTHACRVAEQFSVRLTGEPAEPAPAEISAFLNVLVSITIRIATEQHKDKTQ